MSQEYDVCYVNVAEALGRGLTKEEKTNISDMIKEHVDNSPDHETLLKGLNDAITRGKQEKLIAAAEKKKADLINLQIRENLSRDFQVFADKNSYNEGIKAIFDESKIVQPGAKNGVGHTQARWVSDLASMVDGPINKLKLTQVAISEKFNEPIFKALYRMSFLDHTPEGLADLPKEVVQVAKILNDAKEYSRAAINKLGGTVRYLEGNAVPQSWHPVKLAKWAGGEFKAGAPEHLAAFQKDMLGWIDWKRSYPGLLSLESKNNLLSGMFKEIVEGNEHVNTGERKVHFVDENAAYAAFKKGGYGEGTTDALMNLLRRRGDKLGMLEKLGPSAETNIRSFFSDQVAQMKQQGLHAKVTEVENTFNKLMRYTWPELDGSANIPGNSSLANNSAFVRQLVQAKTYGMAGISALSHPSAGGLTIARALGGSPAVWTGKLIAEMFRGVPEGSTVAELASSLGAVGHTLSTHQGIKFGTPGTMSRMMQTFFKYNFLTAIKEKTEQAATRILSNEYFNNASKEFSALPKRTQDYMIPHGITPEHWDLFRKGEAVSHEGMGFLTPDGIKSLPENSVDSLPGVKDRLEGVSEERAKAIRAEEQNKAVNMFKNLFVDTAHYSTSESGKTVQGMMRMGTKPGTVPGEIVRAVGIAKRFAVAVTQKHFGNALFGYADHEMTTMEAIGNLFKNPRESGLGDISQFIATGTVLGMATGALKDVAKGIIPRHDPKDAGKIMLQGFLTGGGGSIYGDYLFGSLAARNKQSLPVTLAGPLFGTAFDALAIAHDAVQGHKIGGETARFITGNTPFINHPFTKWALDYTFVHQLKEILEPGSSFKEEQSMRKNSGREYFLPPSQVVKRGGGFK